MHEPASGADQLEQASTGLGIDLATLRAQHVTKPGAQAAASKTDQAMDVWPELWPAFQLFQACRGQFVLQMGMGGAQWRAAEAVNVAQHMVWLGIRGRRRESRVWTLYRIFESKALDILNKRAAEQARKKH